MTPLTGPVVIALTAAPAVAMIVAPWLAPRAARRLSPSVATVLLTGLALTVALVTGLLLCMAAVVALAAIPGLSGLGHWSPGLVRDTVPIPVPLGLLAGVVALASLTSAGRYLVRLTVLAHRTSMTASLAPATGGLVVIGDPEVFAFAIPGRHRRIVVSTAMLSTLSVSQRRFLLAHEEAHLRHHHHRYVQLARLAAAANPVLRPIAEAVDLTVERWADESAVRLTGNDRALGARTIAAAALATSPRPASTASLGVAKAHVAERVANLLNPPTRSRVTAATVAVIAVTLWLAGSLAIDHVHGLMELAEPVAAN